MFRPVSRGTKADTKVGTAVRDAVELIAAMSLAREARNRARLRLQAVNDELKVAELELMEAEVVLKRCSDELNEEKFKDA